MICPASLIGNWAKEISERTEFPICRLHGPGREAELRLWMQNGGVAVTSYATLKRLDSVRQIQKDLLVVDEAHYVKNPEANRSIYVQRQIASSERVVLMTGTPLENNAREFIHLIRLCDPSVAERLNARSTIPQAKCGGALP